MWEVNYPGGVGNDNIQWRALIWAVSEGVLLCAVAINYLPPKWYSNVFRFSVALYMVDFLLCVIWLPIGVSKTYGFRTAKEVFTQTCKPYLLDYVHCANLSKTMEQEHLPDGIGCCPCKS